MTSFFLHTKTPKPEQAFDYDTLNKQLQSKPQPPDYYRFPILLTSSLVSRNIENTKTITTLDLKAETVGMKPCVSVYSDDKFIGYVQ